MFTPPPWSDRVDRAALLDTFTTVVVPIPTVLAGSEGHPAPGGGSGASHAPARPVNAQADIRGKEEHQRQGRQEKHWRNERPLTYKVASCNVI